MATDQTTVELQTQILRVETLREVASELAQQTEYLKWKAAQLHLQAAETALKESRNRNRPSVIFGPDLNQGFSGDWIASYGTLYVSGKTPNEAMKNFDQAWLSARGESV